MCLSLDFNQFEGDETKDITSLSVFDAQGIQENLNSVHYILPTTFL